MKMHHSYQDVGCAANASNCITSVCSTMPTSIFNAPPVLFDTITYHSSMSLQDKCICYNSVATVLELAASVKFVYFDTVGVNVAKYSILFDRHCLD